jgi:hypothetical protein
MSNAEIFAAWKKTEGGAEMMRLAYAITAGYFRDYQLHGTQLSIRLVYETLRHRLHIILADFRKRGITLNKIQGYRLNNNLCPHIVRHMIARRPEWENLFELRELKTP